MTFRSIRVARPGARRNILSILFIPSAKRKWRRRGRPDRPEGVISHAPPGHTTCPIAHAPRKVLRSFLKINYRRAMGMAEEKTG